MNSIRFFLKKSKVRPSRVNLWENWHESRDTRARLTIPDRFYFNIETSRKCSNPPTSLLSYSKNSHTLHCPFSLAPHRTEKPGVNNWQPLGIEPKGLSRRGGGAALLIRHDEVVETLLFTRNIRTHGRRHISACRERANFDADVAFSIYILSFVYIRAQKALLDFSTKASFMGGKTRFEDPESAWALVLRVQRIERLVVAAEEMKSYFVRDEVFCTRRNERVKRKENVTKGKTRSKQGGSFWFIKRMLRSEFE